MSILSFLIGSPAPVSSTPGAPVVAAPASAFGTLVSTGLNSFFQVITALGGGIAGSGILPNLLDPSKGPLAALASQNTVVGALMVAASWYISHQVIQGSNATTVAAQSTSAVSVSPTHAAA
jgi:hypothetical protein